MRVADVSLFVKGNDVVPDHLEGVRSLHSLFLWALVSLFYALAQAPELVCIGDSPRVFVFWMTLQLTEQGLASFFIQDRSGRKP